MPAQHGGRMNTTGETNLSAQDQDSDEQQEVIEVQILPQVGVLYNTLSLHEVWPNVVIDSVTCAVR